MRVRTVLFTGGGGAGNEAIYRSWCDRYDLHFADADPAAIDPAIPDGRRHSIPMAHEDGFVSNLLALGRRVGADVIVPGVDEELPKVATLTGQPAILCPPPDFVETALDKLRLASTLAERGIDVPWTISAACADDPVTPCIAKPRRGRGSRGFQFIGEPGQIDAYCRLSPLERSEIVLQEFLEGQEYTVLMAADRNAVLRAVVPVKVLVKRGITLRAETEQADDVIRACEVIHRALPAAGCYNIQLIKTKDGRVAPFEINPRVSTTFCLAVAAGVDPIAIYFGEGTGAEFVRFRSGVTLERRWRNFIAAGKGGG